MRVVVIGTGTIGAAVRKVLEEHGQEVVSVGRKSGDFQADISNMETLRKLFPRIGPFDAVANAAGDVFPGPFEQLTDDQWAKSSSAAAHCGQRFVRPRVGRLDR